MAVSETPKEIPGMARHMKQPPIVCKGIQIRGGPLLPPFTLQSGGLIKLVVTQRIGCQIQKGLVGVLTGKVGDPSFLIEGSKPIYSSEIGRASGIRMGFLGSSLDRIIRRFLNLTPNQRESVYRSIGVDGKCWWSAMRFTEKMTVALASALLVTDKVVFDTAGLDSSGEAIILSFVERKRREGVSFLQLAYVWPESPDADPAEIKIGR